MKVDSRKETAVEITPTSVSYLPAIHRPEVTPTPVPAIEITHIHYGATIDNEWLVVDNKGMNDQDMTGWTITNNANDVYQFPDGFVLLGDKIVRMWSRSGTNTPDRLYWGINKDIWQKNGDTATLWDADGNKIDECPYAGGGVGVDC